MVGGKLQIQINNCTGQQVSYLLLRNNCFWKWSDHFNLSRKDGTL